MANWLADHRLITRVALIVIDVVLLVLAITGLHSSGRHWTAFLTFFSWLVLTASFGWIMPRQVDAWRQRESKPN